MLPEMRRPARGQFDFHQSRCLQMTSLCGTLPVVFDCSGYTSGTEAFMSRELLIFRHGKSDWDSDASRDFDRPLAKRGRKAIKGMAAWACEQQCLPARIASSPAKRARQSTRRFCRYAGLAESIVVWDEAIYAADVPTLLEVLGKHGSEGGRLMIVGHNPGFEELVEYLSGAPVDARAGQSALPTAALAHMDLPDDWRALSPGCGRLLTLTRPRELPGA